MSSAQKDIESPEYLHKFNKKPIFVKPVTLEKMNLRSMDTVSMIRREK
jgi:hypothetical protein